MATTIDTTSPYINAYSVGEVSSTSVDKLVSPSSVDQVSNQLTLTPPEQLQFYNRELSQSIENSSNGIAVTQIANSGLEKQKDMLLEIEELANGITDSLDQQSKDAIVGQIEQLIEEYETVAGSTTFQGESLLEVSGDSSDDLSVVTDDEIVSIYKADTTSISDSLKLLLEDVNTDANFQENFLNVTHQGINELDNFKEDYNDASQMLEKMVKEQLTQRATISSERSTIADIDYSQEVTDFNKTNLLTQMGYLMQTQANAHTQRTISILK